MCIDDDSSFQRSLKTMLKGSNHLESKYTIRDAVSIIEKEPFDLIVLDHLLPDGDGSDFMNQLREPQVNIPVVILTGYMSDTIKDRYLKWEQVKTILSKPLYPDLLQSILEEIPLHTDNSKAKYSNELEVMIGNINHKLKNELTVLCGLFELYHIQLHTSNDEDLRSRGFQSINKINQLCDELSKSVKDFFHNNDNPYNHHMNKILPVKFSGIMEEIICSLSSMIVQYNINLQYNSNIDDSIILTNHNHQKQVCLYLIKNSCNRLQTIHNSKIHITTSINDTFHIIRIADNGKRIPVPYFETRKSILNISPEKKMGLSSLLNSIQPLGWELETQSSKDVGNIIILRIPITPIAYE